MAGAGAVTRVFETEAGERVYGMVASFRTPAHVYHAAEKVRDAGFEKWDVHTPFPIHGLEDAMGIRRTRLPLFVAIVGLSGAGLGFLMEWWMSAVDYPLMVQGKPYFSWQAFIPITFECGILFAAFASLLGMLGRNGLPRLYHPLMKKARFLRATDDTFFISVEAADPKFDPARVRSLFESAHAASVELVEE